MEVLRMVDASQITIQLASCPPWCACESVEAPPPEKTKEPEQE